MSHGTYMHESWHNESWHIYTRVMDPHPVKTDVALPASFTYMCMSHGAFEGVMADMCLVRMSHGTHVHGSWRIHV